MDRGYRRVRPLEGGLEAWVEAGGETESFEII
jgi:3-mercaptopyruvate sulfurtransferase SseA